MSGWKQFRLCFKSLIPNIDIILFIKYSLYIHKTFESTTKQNESYHAYMILLKGSEGR